MPTHYSERVIRMLIERKGVDRAPLYFPFKAERAPRFLAPLFRYLRTRGAGGLRVLEVGCSFGHMTEYLAEQPEIATLSTFDPDAAFVEIARTKAKELGLKVVNEILLLDQAATRRLPWADGAFDLVLAVGVVEHLPERHRRAQVDEYWRVLAPGGHIAFLDTPNRYFPHETHSLRSAPRAVSAAPAGVSLRETLSTHRGELRGLHRRRHRLAQRDPRRVLAVDRLGRRGGRHRGGRLRPRFRTRTSARRARSRTRRGAASAVRCARRRRSRPPAVRRRWPCRT